MSSWVFGLSIGIILLLVWGSFSGCPAQESRQLHVRGDHDYPPFEFLNAEGEPDGFNVDIMRALAIEMGLDIDIGLGPWSEVRSELEHGEIDALLGMFKTEKRGEKIDYSIPHFIASYAIFVRNDSDIECLADLENKHVLVQHSDLGHDLTVNRNLTDRVTTYQEVSEVLIALSEGQGDCAIASRLQGRLISDRLGLVNIRGVGPKILQRKYCIAVKKGDSDLLAEFNEGLSILKTSGEFDRIYENWFGVFQEEKLTFSKAIRYLSLFLTLLLLLFVIGAFWFRTLQKRVAQSTLELRSELRVRRRVERELRLSERNQAITLDALSEAVIVVDAEGRIIRLNPAAIRLLDVKPQEAVSCLLPEVIQLVNEDTGESVALPLEEILAKGEFTLSPDGPLLLQRGNARRRVDGNLTSIHSDDDLLVGHVLVLRDMTERRELEMELHQMQKMDSITGLAAGVAHDYNNTLHGIMGYAELLTEDASLAPKQLGYAERILTSVRRASRLTDKLLAFTRQGKLLTSPLAIDTVIKDAISLLAPGLPKNIELYDDLHSPRAAVLCDAGQIQNVILNLGVNARDAMPKGGRLEITSRIVTLAEESHFVTGFCIPAGDYVLIRVSDTGEGIEREIQKRIFEPFFSTRKRSPSSGLGLSSVYGTMQDHNGAITMSNGVKGGAVFDLYLPVSAMMMIPGLAPETAEIYGDGCVMIVDDEEVVRELCVDMFKSIGVNVITARDGQAGLKKFKEHRDNISMIILDVIMPRMNGIDCFRAIRQLDAEVPIVIASGYTDADKIDDLENIGAFAFIKKPFNKAVLQRLLSDSLKRPS
ncbi:MAG: transporter substrate-binding domain-containing protein [bacterium]|nr:transporter substrate-binding domain-containing protein [bacterium]